MSASPSFNSLSRQKLEKLVHIMHLFPVSPGGNTDPMILLQYVWKRLRFPRIGPKPRRTFRGAMSAGAMKISPPCKCVLMCKVGHLFGAGTAMVCLSGATSGSRSIVCVRLIPPLLEFYKYISQIKLNNQRWDWC